MEGILTIIILGAGGHAKELEEQLKSVGDEHIMLLTLEKELALLENTNFETSSIYIGVGSPAIRKIIINRWKEYSFLFPVLTQKNTYISDSADIGFGCVLQFGSVVSTQSVLGPGVLINWNSTIGHHSSIGEGVVVNPNASISGYCEIGDGVLIGTGARILEGVKVGANSIIGAGSVVTRDVKSGERMVGIPARAL